MAKAPIGYIVWEGPSHDGSPIAVVINCISRPSKNDKTDAMAQSWIIRTDVDPYTAVKQNLDSAVCGRCPFAGGQGCYVNLKPVGSIYNALKAGSYKRANLYEVADAMVRRIQKGKLKGLRVGSYGDPAMVPADVWLSLVSAVRAAGGRTTGYTHQWSEAYAPPSFNIDPRLKTILMASAHTVADVEAAKAQGWRPFASMASVEAVQNAGLGLCPASKEAGYRKTCASCGLQGACNGRKDQNDRRVGMGIPVHGDAVKLNQARRTIRRLEVG